MSLGTSVPVSLRPCQYYLVVGPSTRLLFQWDKKITFFSFIIKFKKMKVEI